MHAHSTPPHRMCMCMCMYSLRCKALATIYGREDLGVVFCGAPLIAAALKATCEKLSDRERTVFRLHKENF